MFVFGTTFENDETPKYVIIKVDVTYSIFYQRLLLFQNNCTIKIS
jgi:hypothetical protein